MVSILQKELGPTQSGNAQAHVVRGLVAKDQTSSTWINHTGSVRPSFINLVVVNTEEGEGA